MAPSVVLFYQQCNGLGSYPFVLGTVIIMVLCIMIPLIIFPLFKDENTMIGFDYIDSIDNENKEFRIPAISKAWRNSPIKPTVAAGGVISITVYSYCLVDWWFIFVFDFILVFTCIVFIVNTDPPHDGFVIKDPDTGRKVKHELGEKAKEYMTLFSCIHGILAFILFTGLVCVAGLISANYYNWEPQAIVLFVLCLISYITVIAGDVYTRVKNNSTMDQKLKRKIIRNWTWWTSLAEIFMVAFFLFLVLFINQIEYINVYI